MIATLAMIIVLGQVGGPSNFQPSRATPAAGVDTVQVQEEVRGLVGVAELVTSVIRPFLPKKITEAWLLAGAFSVFSTVVLLAKLLGWTGWWRMGLDVFASFALSANTYLPDVSAFIFGGVALSAVTVIVIKASTEGGDIGRRQLEKRNLAPKPRGEFNRGPSLNPGGDQ